MKRLTYVCADGGIPVFGSKGASIHAQEILREFIARGWQVDLAAARVGGNAPAGLESVQLHSLDAIATCARDADLVYERYSLTGGAGIAAAYAAGISSVLEVNAPLIDEHLKYRGNIDRTQLEADLRITLSKATLVVCVSPGVADWVRNYCSPSDVSIIVEPNGVNTDRIRPRPDGVAPSPYVTVGFVGTLKPWHGVEYFLDALAMARAADADVRGLIVGDGPELARLQDLAVHLGIAEHTEFTGAVPSDDVPTLLQRMDCAVAPYPPDADTYFSPLKVFEYLAAGLPIIASSVGQIPEILKHGELGILVPSGDARAMANAIVVLNSMPKVRRQLAHAARAAAIKHHTWQHVVDSVLSELPIYEAAIR